MEPMSSRERASTIVLAVIVAAAAWVGVLGCIAIPYGYYNGPIERRVRAVYEWMPLNECRQILPMTPVGHKDVDGMRIDAFGHQYAYQESSKTPSFQRQRFYFFYEGRLVLWSDRVDWDAAASEAMRLRERDKANAAEEQRMFERAQAEEAARNAPMGDSW